MYFCFVSFHDPCLMLSSLFSVMNPAVLLWCTGIFKDMRLDVWTFGHFSGLTFDDEAKAAAVKALDLEWVCQEIAWVQRQLRYSHGRLT